MQQWQTFFVAQAGASAALVGLVFVALSINLTRILELDRADNARLTERALGALTVLLTILVVSSLLLAPGVSAFVAALLLLVVGVIDWLIQIVLQTARWRAIDPQYRKGAALTGALGQAATLLIAWSGVAVALWGFAGLYWIVPSVILTYIFSIEEAWVLLVEINR